ncbi:pyridoxine 5'-phosphate synthase [uncultured Eudoraea sp.]|uniref:pyridoxine 5'-phosphate synthase n=1 Tax=uncultured Eudoraea sp. TaxID=1035614 RepID=UPI002613DFDD|nr:pyridoxine 5'-phosphate synthase [uncultured Eudoraea sp.]
MTKLSVNVNKIATLRNSRGGNVPNLLKVVADIEDFGAQGITIHPRPDERHIKYEDALKLREVVTTELNIEGNPITHKDFLKEVIGIFKEKNIRTSIFVDPVISMVTGAANTGADRIELYTEQYAKSYETGKKLGIQPFVDAANAAHKLGLGINAGHDLSLNNIKYFREKIPHLLEVSIGHALICESLYLGLENVINMYLHRLK